MLTKEELAAIKVRHYGREHASPVAAGLPELLCDHCEIAWPCDAARLLDVLREWTEDLAADGYDAERVVTFAETWDPTGTHYRIELLAEELG